jgi:hypothetical protein
VPGGGLFRDGARSLVLCAPLVAALAGHAAGRLTARVAEDGARVVLAGALVLVPVMLMPDGTFGLGGRIEAVDYPSSYAAARVAAARTSGDALVLPLTAYRQPTWNDRRKLLDPMSRWLSRDVVASDRLVIGRTLLAGEDPRVEDASAALRVRTPPGRADALSRLGFGVVVVEKDAGGAPEVAGRVLLDDDAVAVIALDDPAQRRIPTGWLVAASAAWAAYAAGPLLFPVVVSRRRNGNRRNAVTNATG